MKRFTHLLLPLLLVVSSCGGEESTNDDNARLGGGDSSGNVTSTSSVDAGAQTPATPVSSVKVPDSGAAAMADQGIQEGERPLLPPGYRRTDQGPKRDPEFHFEPGGAIADADLKDYYIEMTTSIDGKEVGTMSFELWGDQAPITVRNFLRYADEGFYDGLSFHRILREFMLQGGDPVGDGSGDGPYGRIKGEMSNDPSRQHGYGVLSMARGRSIDSASSQFFLCCAETPSVWNLDGNYTSFGRMTQGVDVLEQIASVPVTKGRSGEPSLPMRRVIMDKVVVKKGTAPKGEEIKRPKIDLGGEPEKVMVRHVLISFKGAIPTATRSKEEAEKLAAEVLAKAKAGEDFDQLVRTYSDDNIQENDPAPGSYFMTNRGVADKENFLILKDLNEQMQKKQDELRAKINAKEIDLEAARSELAAYQISLMPPGFRPAMSRDEMVKGFGDTAFSLKVGEVGITNYHPQDSKYGWHIIKRIK